MFGNVCLTSFDHGDVDGDYSMPYNNKTDYQQRSTECTVTKSQSVLSSTKMQQQIRLQVSTCYIFLQQHNAATLRPVSVDYKYPKCKR